MERLEKIIHLLPLTLQEPTPQNGQSHSVDELNLGAFHHFVGLAHKVLIPHNIE